MIFFYIKSQPGKPRLNNTSRHQVQEDLQYVLKLGIYCKSRTSQLGNRQELRLLQRKCGMFALVLAFIDLWKWPWTIGGHFKTPISVGQDKPQGGLR